MGQVDALLLEVYGYSVEGQKDRPMKGDPTMNVGLEYYQKNYPNYARQNPDRKMRFYRELVRLGLKDTESRPKLLDLGCAFGRFLGYVGDEFEGYGQEPNSAALDIASQLMDSSRLRCHPLPEIAFQENFDAIVAFDVFEHVEDIEAVRHALTQRLAPNGCIVFVVPVYDGITGPIVHLLDKDTTHVHKRSRWFWLDWIGKDFDVIQWYGVYRYLLMGYYFHIPTRRLRKFTPAIAVVARPRNL